VGVPPPFDRVPPPGVGDGGQGQRRQPGAAARRGGSVAARGPTTFVATFIGVAGVPQGSALRLWPVRAVNAKVLLRRVSFAAFVGEDAVGVRAGCSACPPSARNHPDRLVNRSSRSVFDKAAGPASGRRDK